MVESGIVYVRVVTAASPSALEDAINELVEMERVEGAQVVDVRITALTTTAPQPPDGLGTRAQDHHCVALILLRSAPAPSSPA